MKRGETKPVLRQVVIVPTLYEARVCNGKYISEPGKVDNIYTRSPRRWKHMFLVYQSRHESIRHTSESSFFFSRYESGRYTRRTRSKGMESIVKERTGISASSRVS